MSMRSNPCYELFYWPFIPGRGEYVRLMFEAAGMEYVDVARDEPGGLERLTAMLEGDGEGTLPFAPPFLKVGSLVLAQTAAICQFLGPRLGLVPDDETSRLAAHQHQLTIADFVDEAHDTHHPLGVSLYYEDQKEASAKRAQQFRDERMPKFMAYFERVLEGNPQGEGRWMIGARPSYPDLSLFHTLEGLAYAFPNAFGKLEPTYPCLATLHAAVRQLPRVAQYLASERRMAFNEDGIFRRYPELDPA